MKRLLLLLAACSEPVTPSPDVSLNAGTPGARAYIVQLAEGAEPGSIAHNHGLAPRFIYRHAINGFAANIPEQALAGLRRNPLVRTIEPDGVVSIDAYSWGTDRIDQRALPLNNAYGPPNHGAGVRVYVLDTGVRYTHPELAGRVAQGIDIIGQDANADDCHGHGTHVAGTVAGLTVGVANQATIVSVRMLGCDGSATWSQAIAGVDWVIANHMKPAVANMSWGGSSTLAVIEAVRRLVESGVTVAAAAGNGNTDACGFSPANTPEALTVAASTIADTRASFSNFGTCVDLFGPGESINSSVISGGYGNKSGTSMASPHVAGVAALYLAANPLATPATVAQAVLGGATPDKIADVQGSPNRLAYSGIAGAGVLPPLPPPPLPVLVGPIWIGDMDDATSVSSRGEWLAEVRIQIISETGQSITAWVEGMFSVMTKWGEREVRTGLCESDLNGACTVQTFIPNKYVSAMFRLKFVNGIDGAQYLPDRNTDPDGDSDGSVIVVRKP